MSINPPTVNQLGVLITSAQARKVIYGVYVLAIIGTGAAQVFFAATSMGAPSWFAGVVAVLAYLGAPVGALAVANTPPKAAAFNPGGD